METSLHGKTCGNDIRIQRGQKNSFASVVFITYFVT